MKEVIISPKAIEELDESITQVQDGLAIICNGNTHAAIENEHFAYVKNHPDLPDGLYQAKAAIAANEALSTSNLTADPSGGLNKLKEGVDALNSKSTIQTTYSNIIDQSGSGFVVSRIGNIVCVSGTLKFSQSPGSDMLRAYVSGLPVPYASHKYYAIIGSDAYPVTVNSAGELTRWYGTAPAVGFSLPVSFTYIAAN